MGTLKKCAYKHNNARINLVRIWVVTYTQAEALRIFDPTGYCHNHGWRVHATHSSATCRKKGRRHNDAATRADTKGGSNKYKGWDTNPNPM